MPDIFEIYGWLFKGILWIPVIALLLFVLFWVLVVVGPFVGFVLLLAVAGVGLALFYMELLYLRL